MTFLSQFSILHRLANVLWAWRDENICRGARFDQFFGGSSLIRALPNNFQQNPEYIEVGGNTKYAELARAACQKWRSLLLSHIGRKFDLTIAKEKNGVKNAWKLWPSRGGLGVWRLMEKTILNFNFDYLHTSLIIIITYIKSVPPANLVPRTYPRREQLVRDRCKNCYARKNIREQKRDPCTRAARMQPYFFL